jgi:hypothetical protein
VTVEVWLRRWLASRLSLRLETVRSYGGYIDDYLVPYLGQVLLADLNRSRFGEYLGQQLGPGGRGPYFQVCLWPVQVELEVEERAALLLGHG